MSALDGTPETQFLRYDGMGAGPVSDGQVGGTGPVTANVSDWTGGPEGAATQSDVRGALNHVALGLTALAEASAAARGDHELADRTHEIFRLNRDKDTFEVHVDSDLTLEDYQSITPPEVWGLMQRWAEPLQGRSVVFVNATMEGGGVAMLRPTLVHIFRMLGIDAHWYVLEPFNKQEKAEHGDPFGYTKLMHNITQRRAGEARITEEGKALHRRMVMEKNWPVLSEQDNIQNADFVIFDDPQPAPMIDAFRRLNPTAITGWRNHIDNDRDLMADETTPQGEVASYLLDECHIDDVDFAIYHPNPQFVNDRLDDRAYFAPATIDPFDNLNRHLSDAEVETGIEFINDEIAKKNAEFIAEGREEDVQPLLNMDPDTPRVTLVARFDESKGMDHAMELGVQAKYEYREQLIAQGLPADEVEEKVARLEIVIVGNGSPDDPSGVPMYEQMLKLRRERYPHDKSNITIMRLRHNYDAMNALMRRTKILMQTSEAEGMETRISDGINHGLPVVISNRGAMFTQIPEHARRGARSSHILDFNRSDHGIPNGARFIGNLLANPDEYAAASQEALQHAQTYNRIEFSTSANTVRFLRMLAREQARRELLALGQTSQAEPLRADKQWLMSDLVTEAKHQGQAIGALILVGGANWSTLIGESADVN